MTRRSAWAAIAGCTLPIALQVCVGLPLSWCAATVLMAAAVLAAATERRDAVITLVLGLATCARLYAGGPFGIPGMQPLLLHLADMRAGVTNRIGLLLPEPQASFLAGVLTGERTEIPPDITLQMQRTGLTHILAISGTNITLILVFLDHLLVFVPRQWKVMPLGASIVLFTLFSGASASAVRACIMGMLQLFALHTGRVPQHRLLIGWTCAAMLLWNPQQLRDDAGFQLSFLAVIGLCELQDALKTLLRRVPKAWGMQEALVMTLAAQATASPWAAFIFGTLPLHSALLNIVVAPLIPIAMLSGTAALGISVISTDLARIVALPAWAALSGILLTGRWGAAWSLPVLDGLQASPTLLAVWLLCLAGLLWMSKRKPPRPAIVETHASA